MGRLDEQDMLHKRRGIKYVRSF